jgi:hypothetical protein
MHPASRAAGSEADNPHIPGSGHHGATGHAVADPGPAHSRFILLISFLDLAYRSARFNGTMTKLSTRRLPPKETL